MIVSGDGLKVVSFYFGRQPNADAYVATKKEKFYKRLWLLQHLIKAGVPNLDVLGLYNSLVRPVLEFAAPVFQSLLTAKQAGEIEQLQAMAGTSPTRVLWKRLVLQGLVKEDKN